MQTLIDTACCAAGQVQLVTLLSKINTPEEAKLGLHAIAMMRRHRSQNQQHTPFNKDVVWTFLRVR